MVKKPSKLFSKINTARYLVSKGLDPLLRQRGEAVMGHTVRFKNPKTSEELTGIVVGVDPRPYRKQDGLWLIIKLPQLDPQHIGDVVTILMSDVF